MARKSVRVKKELWSEKSKAGLDYAFAGQFYEDQRFTCRACGKPSVFTAEQQKYTYEVKKAYTWEQHVLCQACFSRRNKLEAKSADFAALWKKNKKGLKDDRAALRRWKEVLESLPRYGVPEDKARIRMITTLLDNAA